LTSQPRECFARVGPLELCYERFGRPGDPVVLLVMGLGAQMIAWPEAFCERLAAEGFHVVRYDNRDCGRSTHMTRGHVPTLVELATRRIRTPAYTLDDLADDAAGLLEQLGVSSAHVVGASMGGMIGQVLAVRHPRKVRSLVSVMANTGSRTSGQPAMRLMPYLLRRPPAAREAFVEHMVKTLRLIGSPRAAAEEAALRALVELMYERGAPSDGVRRQLGAVFASGNRTAQLRRITAPALVIHGADDRLIPPSGGRATARAIPGAELLLIERMGHDLPAAAWQQIVEAIVANAMRASGEAAA
jgi:pimeloyl-ACP methyl ester carboxylesterase